MFKRILVVSFVLMLAISPAYAGSVTLEGGEWIVRNNSGDSVATLSSDLTRDQALRNAFFMLYPDTGTVEMNDINLVVSTGEFEIWKDGSVIDTATTKDDALQILKDNKADSITHPPDGVGTKK